MTTKEQAEELVMSFLNIKSNGAEKSGWAGMDTYMAKQCALVTVDEIITYLKSFKDLGSVLATKDGGISFIIDEIISCEAVKSEIEKL